MDLVPISYQSTEPMYAYKSIQYFKLHQHDFTLQMASSWQAIFVQVFMESKEKFFFF
jgi:hypothetical protein